MISILLAVNNGQEYISQTIDSILSQSYEDFELIIVVNFSTDKTVEIIKSYTDQRIRLYETNIGQLSFNLNFALMKSRGEYIARIDADDIADSDRLLKQVEYLDKGYCDIVGTNINYINDDGLCLGGKFMPEGNVDIRKNIYFKSVLAHPTILMRKSILISNSGYLGGRYAQDYDLWLRIMRDESIIFYNIQEPLVSYRIHDEQSKGNISSYAEVAGYLLRESIVSRSLKCFFGSVLYTIKSFVKSIV